MTAILDYRKQLDADPEWALMEGFMAFDATNKPHHALKKITTRLDELGVEYVIVGGMAMYQHGFRRFTDDVDLLVTPETLKYIHSKLDGLGYVPPFTGSKHLRDAELGVKIEFLTTGGYPGDGKPKPIQFPDPKDVCDIKNGYKVLDLRTLVELKLASGTSSNRLKDLGDVQELIRKLQIPRTLGDEIHPFVRDKFFEIWDAVDHFSEDD